MTPLKNSKLSTIIEDGENNIKVLKIDWGGKFLSNEFNTYFVLRQLMIIEMPHQNDVVEHLEKQNQFGKGQKHNNGN